MVEHSQYNIAKNIFSINLGYFKEGQRRMKIAVIQGSSQKEKRSNKNEYNYKRKTKQYSSCG